MSHDLLYLLLGGGAGPVMGHRIPRRPVPLCSLPSPAPIPSLGSAAFPSTGPGLAFPTVKAPGRVLPLGMVAVPSAW